MDLPFKTEGGETVVIPDWDKPWVYDRSKDPGIRITVPHDEPDVFRRLWARLTGKAIADSTEVMLYGDGVVIPDGAPPEVYYVCAVWGRGPRPTE